MKGSLKNYKKRRDNGDAISKQGLSFNGAFVWAHAENSQRQFVCSKYPGVVTLHSHLSRDNVPLYCNHALQLKHVGKVSPG
ncbi:MAG: hypothetical protein HRU72_03565 [Planctomycetia bacterium]|nr:MAG: hypothetical protein HRU72_03565 [Planctomycetia bacterium]GJQ23547.1 MAG: hypothetical protein HBSAPP01_13370 [Candidatus Brocadia sapporoensis]